jgi:hypothetical protein
MQVTRLVATLAHLHEDQDDIARARVSEAQAGLIRVMELDEAVKKFRGELDSALKMVQDKFYSLQDNLQDLTPNGRSYRVTQPKGTTNVQPQGQAQRQGTTPTTKVSAGGNPEAIGTVLPTGTGEGRKDAWRAETGQPALDNVS